MNERWKMSRLGFVNFWLYDDQEFDLSDGKLLLRGQNGSGKSITTQSIIPFILDGDRTPSRLDPFGSGDRRMDWYFLGDGDKEESTGYLYLEFRKPGSEEYRTIGIGQHARRNQKMTFWGFVVTDGRRIGRSHEICLYSEKGDSRIPLSKRELRRVLGEETPFTESPGEYKEFVNRYLFGFPRIDQYDQFVRLLIKVRAPKLSKEFKPTKVYDILNESLQVLTDDDIRAMADAMDKLDQIQETLEGLERAYQNAMAISREYQNYNRYILARKAQNYLDGRNRAEDSKRHLEERKQQIIDWRKELQELRQKKAELENEAASIQNQIEQLLDPEIENMDRKRENTRNELENARKKKAEKEDQIQEKNSLVGNLESRMTGVNQDIQGIERKLSKTLDEMTDIQEEIHGKFHEDVLALAHGNLDGDEKKILSEITALLKAVRLGREKIAGFRQAETVFDEVLQNVQENDKATTVLRLEAERTEKEKESEQTAVIQNIQNMRNNRFWIPEDSTIERTMDRITDYVSARDGIECMDIFRDDLDQKKKKSESHRTVLEIELKNLTEEKQERLTEYEKLRNQRDVEPIRDEDSIRTRKSLKEAGISAWPFYETVDFDTSLTDEQQGMVEQQLWKAGLLDALVVSGSDYETVMKEHPEFLDTVIPPIERKNAHCAVLKAEESLPDSLRETVETVLSNINGDSGKLILGMDGMFRHGLLAGRVHKERSEYIGTTARKKYKERILSEMEKKIQKLDEEIHSRQEEIVKLNGCLEGMNRDFENIPSWKKIDLLIEKHNEIQLRMKGLLEVAASLQKKLNQAEVAKDSAKREMLKICTGLPYARTEQSYSQICDDIESYKDLYHEVSSFVKDLEMKRSENNQYEERRDNVLQDIDRLFLEKKEQENRIISCEAMIRQISEFLDSPEIIEKAKKLEEAHAREKANRDESFSVSNRFAVCCDRLAEAEEQIEALENRYSNDSDFLRYVAQYFEEELDLRLVCEKSGESLYDNAVQAVKCCDKETIGKEAGEILNRLMGVFNKNSSDLSIYGVSMEELFKGSEDQARSERVRSCIYAVWEGKKLQITDFRDQLSDRIDETKLLIQKQDRELFENILSQTISQKLTDRISESRNWVRNMSALMKNMETSMGMNFTLEWKPKESETADELSTRELEKVLTKDKELITNAEIDSVARHFRTVIHREKELLDMQDVSVNYMDLVRDALDYRKWFEFRMSYTRTNEPRRELTNAAFNRFSGGEKAMAMYVPLFAAVNAQYEKAELEDHPRLIALDEAFAGVDDRNINSMFELVEKLDFDYIMNSQVLWGCYESVHALRISELLRPMNANIVTVINYLWNGKERKLDER